MGDKRYRNLDALRGICALTVVLFHGTNLFAPGRVFCHGYLAVDLFFILSGFVIAARYEEKLSGGMSAGAFLCRRVMRLAPVYWAGTLLIALALILAESLGGHQSWPIAQQTLAAIMLVPQIAGNDYAYPGNFVAWSLSGELVVNLLYACGLFKLSTRALILLVSASWILALSVAFRLPEGWDFGTWAWEIILVPLRAVPGFLAGVVLYRLHHIGKLSRLPALSPMLIIAVWLAISGIPASGPTPLFDFMMVALGGPVLIALLVRGNEIGSRALLWLGAISYPLYASHRAVVVLAKETGWLGHGTSALRGFVYCLVAIVTAAVIHHIVELRTTNRQRTAPA